MTVEHITSGLYKVVNTMSDHGYGGVRRSALLHGSRASIDYNMGRLFIPPTDGTAVLAFNDQEAAFEFADKFRNRQVFTLEAYGEIVPMTRVLKIKHRGWDANLEAFWKAVRDGADLSGFETLKAAPFSVAIFGVVRLGTQVTRTPAAVPAGVNSRAQREM